MRLTDNRYATEQAQFELALRMIGHEARTHTIHQCTGLSDDRIRKVYKTYFNHSGSKIRRRRGKSPQQIGLFFKTCEHQLEAMTLIALFCSGLLLRHNGMQSVKPCWRYPDVEYGHRFCRAYETYQLLHPKPVISFEWAWNLLQRITANDELKIQACSQCSALYLYDAYALDNKQCPSCEIASNQKPAKLSSGLQKRIRY